MISEKRLAQDYVSFWQQLLPMSEFVVKQLNLHFLERFSAPLGLISEPSRRGLINETAFFVFRALVANNRTKLTKDDFSDVQLSARNRIALLDRKPLSTVAPLSMTEKREVLLLSDAIREFFLVKVDATKIVVDPKFRGCGILDSCFGDVLADKALFELKAGARQFRSVDFRQIFIYCALNYSAKSYDIETVSLVNPRHGTYLWLPVDDLINRFSGLRSMQLFEEILQYVSSGGISK